MREFGGLGGLRTYKEGYGIQKESCKSGAYIEQELDWCSARGLQPRRLRKTILNGYHGIGDPLVADPIWENLNSLTFRCPKLKDYSSDRLAVKLCR